RQARTDRPARRRTTVRTPRRPSVLARPVRVAPSRRRSSRCDRCSLESYATSWLHVSRPVLDVQPFHCTSPAAGWWRADRRNLSSPSTMSRGVRWIVRELAAEETYGLRRAVSADGRTDLPSMHYDLDDASGTWHFGAVDAAGHVVATSSFYVAPCPTRPAALPAVELKFMAVEPLAQRQG